MEEKNIVKVSVEQNGDTTQVNGGGVVTADNGTVIETEYVGTIED